MTELTNLGGYHVDLVMCIDKTGSMYSLINGVKETAKTFCDQFKEAMKNSQKIVTKFRVKVIAFGDYGCNAKPMVESEFFELDDQKGEYINFVNGLEAEGGGDDAENAYEAIALAFKSDWVRTGGVRRHVTMVFTDAPALPFSARREEPLYPSDMPEDLAELQEIWESQEMETRAKRLILLTPDDSTWTEMGMWNNTFQYHSAAGIGTTATNMDEILRLLVKSV